MPTGLKRYYGQKHFHFVTFSCYQRLPLLASGEARNLFLGELTRVRGEYRFLLAGYVLMPNHVHLLMSEPERGTLSTVMQMLKQRVSRKMHKREEGIPAAELHVNPRERIEKLPQFWQSRFYDFNVYAHGKMMEKLNYMHANPLTRGLVKHPGDWLWSSWSFYEKREPGLISIDVVNF